MSTSSCVSVVPNRAIVCARHVVPTVFVFVFCLFVHLLVSCRYKVTIKQTGFERGPEGNNGPWDFPVHYALVRNGHITHEGVWRVTEATSVFTVAGVAQKPDFLSFARDWSFFGRVDRSDVSNDVLVKQAMSDPDVLNR